MSINCDRNLKMKIVQKDENLVKQKKILTPTDKELPSVLQTTDGSKRSLMVGEVENSSIDNTEVDAGRSLLIFSTLSTF